MPKLFSKIEGLYITDNTTPEAITSEPINIGASIFHVIPLTIMTPTIIAKMTSVVPKSFCSKISTIGIKAIPIILKNNLKSVSKDLLKVNWLCFVTILANAKMITIFINSEGWTLIGPNVYQLFAPFMIGVIGVSGITSNKSNETHRII